MRDTPPPPATEQDGSYPRPQLLRSDWVDLSGPWRFDFDDLDVGRTEGWFRPGHDLTGSITVPFPPESPASGLHEPGYHRVLWYRRTVTAAEIAATGHASGRRLLLHFGAVDYRADVWVDGEHVGSHEGGHTPFTVEVPDPAGGVDVVVRAEDDPLDLTQPRGKQDWELEPHVVWYHRTSGIWQPVWLESVPRQHVAGLAWRPDAGAATVRLAVDLAERPAPETRLRVVLRLGDRLLAEHTVLVTAQRIELDIAVPALRNGQSLEEHLWSPANPRLVDAAVELTAPGRETDAVASYFGFRDVATGDGRFLLNGRPHRVRGILSQGYWPGSHLAAPDADALRREAELIKDLGFTTVRVHQKIEDPRFHYWADRLGLLVWVEMPSAYEFSPSSAERLTREWLEVVRRDLSHPSVVVWVPFNESWGVQQVAGDARQQHLVRALTDLTNALDGTRPVVSNDGWEHLRSDLLTVHDYRNDPDELRASYGDRDAAARAVAGVAPNGRRMVVGTPEERAATLAAPLLLTEFGGVSDGPPDDGWGYRIVPDRGQLERHLEALFRAVHDSEALAGWCFTQLTDTAQETNGLVDEHRVPKLPVERIRAIVEGSRPDP